ncbi:MAG: HAMP domain-containing sensor histidine kinase, partial [Thioalkalispiraceae bacterium]
KVRSIMRDAYLEKNQTVEDVVYQGKTLDLSRQLSSLLDAQDSIFVQIEILEQLIQQNHKSRLTDIEDTNRKRILLITVITLLVILTSLTLSMAIISRKKSQDRIIDRYIEEINHLNKSLEKRVQQRTNELVLARDEAERSSQVKSEFLSNMSHELRTPLNAIYGSAQILQTLTKDFKEDDKEWVHHILDSSRHLKNLINDVLDISKISAGKLTIAKTEVSIEDSLVDGLESIRPLLMDKKITLTREKSCSYHVVADPLRLKQVLINLLTNAIKYNHIGGLIDLSCTELENGFVRINIKDSGEGINEEDLPRVFDMFERLGKEGSTSLGSGVGLALCMKLVQMMGGDIGVRSQKEQGSTFWIDLPQA